MMLTAERLREVLDYDLVTGVFCWRFRKGARALAGAVAGTVHRRSGYVRIKIDGRLYEAHRLAWLYVKGTWPAGGLDHRDLDRRFNAICNLREATRGQNRANSKSTTGSGLNGAYPARRSGRWVAMITTAGVSLHLGTFDSPEAAHAAYMVAAAKHHGEFARG